MANDTRMKAALLGRHLLELYARVRGARPVPGDPHSERAIRAAFDELGAHLKVEHPLEGGWKATVPQSAKPEEYEFSMDAVHGIKIALIQSFVGSREVPGETYGDRQHLLRIAERFSRKLRKVIEDATAAKAPDEKDAPESLEDEPEEAKA